MKRLNQDNFIAFMALHASRNDAFTLLMGLSQWLRKGKAKNAPKRVEFLIAALQADKELTRRVASVLCRWLYKVRLYPLLISVGIFSRDGFGRELVDRFYERINPAYKDPADLRDVFSQLFSHQDDILWLTAIPEKSWLKLLNILLRHTPAHDRKTAHDYLLNEGLNAIEMLAIWIAAEELEPDLIRLDKKLLDRDSAFVALNREVAAWVQARSEQQDFDDSHLNVMMGQCRRQVETLRKKGTGAGAGSSLSVAHLLERLDQTLNRLQLLMGVFAAPIIPPRRMLALTGSLAHAAAQQHSFSWLWKRSIRMLSRSITQNTSSHGEHYITRNKKEYLGMLYSAAGGGVLIALMSLLKIHLGETIDNRFWLAVAEGLNYGLGFTLIFMLHFTVATKQPAMTASLFAAVVEKTDTGRAVNQKLAILLIDVLRSQTAAVAGNVGVAVMVAMVIALGYRLFTGSPLLNEEQITYQLHSIDPTSPALWYAAIAGIWLFCSGIISGFFDNRCDYLDIRRRLRHHPLLKWLPEKWRNTFADYMHDNYGSIIGNLSFGMLLGMTGFVGYALGLPLDIRHVAFSSANVGYLSVSGGVGLWVFLQSLLFILLIGTVNLLVSFSLTLWVALRSRGTQIDSWWGIISNFIHIVRQRPLSLFLPIQLPPESESDPKK